jgi:hypothetical protein
MEYIFYWLLCSIVVGVIAAYGRARNGGGWFLLALLISPLLAGILVLCLPAQQPKRLTRRQIVEQIEHLRTLRECPFCAEMVKLQAKVCKHCHSELPPPVIEQHSTQPRPTLADRLNVEW